MKERTQEARRTESARFLAAAGEPTVATGHGWYHLKVIGESCSWGGVEGGWSFVFFRSAFSFRSTFFTAEEEC